jgi:hypothetical protein
MHSLITALLEIDPQFLDGGPCTAGRGQPSTLRS